MLHNQSWWTARLFKTKVNLPLALAVRLQLCSVRSKGSPQMNRPGVYKITARLHHLRREEARLRGGRESASVAGGVSGESPRCFSG